MTTEKAMRQALKNLPVVLDKMDDSSEVHSLAVLLQAMLELGYQDGYDDCKTAVAEVGEQGI